MVKKKVVRIIVVLFSIVFLSQQCFAAESPDPLVDAKALLEQAIEYQKNKDYESAERLYQSVIGDYQGSSFALNAREKLAIVYISTERDADAQAMVDDLMAGFADAAGLPKAVYNIARAFERHERRVDAAKKIYQQIIERWPDDAEAGKAGLRLARMDVLSLIASGQDSEAQAKLDSLTADFSGQEADLAQVVYDAARAYEREPRRKYDAANKVYQQFIERWPESELVEKIRLSMAGNEVLLLIDAGDVSGAQAATEKLATDFSGDLSLSAVLYRIAKRYEDQGEYEAARSDYQQIIQRYPDSPQAGKARLGIPRSETLFSIADGNDITVQQGLDQLISDFNDHWYLPTAIFQIAEQYYSKAYSMQNEGRYEQAKDYFGKAIIIFERIIQEFPASTTTQHAYHLLADCYHWFGDKYCGAYAVWHTLYHYGLAKPMDVIVKEMQIERKGSVSIYEIVQALKTGGISAYTVKLDLEKISTIDSPFIQYIAPIKGEQLGHFVLCIPTGSGKAVMLDGAEEPKVFELASFEQYDYQQTGWDGTSILINGISKSTSYEPISGLSDLGDLLQIAANWLETGYDAWAGADLTGESHLSLDIQLSLRGGCHDNCKPAYASCFDDEVSCDSDHDCLELAGEVLCYDKTKEETCQTPGSSPDCVYDSSHTCNPQRQLTGWCNISAGYCEHYGSQGNCETKRRVKQCHN